MMNPRRVHDLMTAHFPQVELVTLNWVNVLEADGTIRREVLDRLIDEFIHADDILVEVNRKLGDFKSRGQVIPYAQKHVGKGQIRMADWPAADSKDTMLRWKMESGGINGSKKAVQPRVQARGRKVG